jgi:hypothetical protein
VAARWSRVHRRPRRLQTRPTIRLVGSGTVKDWLTYCVTAVAWRSQRFQRNVLRLRLGKSVYATIHLRVNVPTYVTIWEPLRGVDRSYDRTTRHTRPLIGQIRCTVPLIGHIQGTHIDCDGVVFLVRPNICISKKIYAGAIFSGPYRLNNCK